MSEEALRLNKGKNRLDLVPPSLIEEVGKVMTFGAEKYEPYNWAKGMKWSKCIASAKRHLSAYERGEDFDPETKMYHLSHLGCNIAFLLEYYKTCPELDDRQHKYLHKKKIGLDVDEVLADLVGTLMYKFPDKIKDRSVYFKCPDFLECFNEIKNDEDFYLSIIPKIDGKTLPFEPSCYITARCCSSEITEKWLDKYGFPKAPVYTVGLGNSKVELAKQSGVDIFVDDSFDNFVELNKAGVCTFLMDAPHNQRYSVGYKRIYSLKELV